MLPPSLWLMVAFALPTLTYSSPSPPYLVGDDFTHLVPRHMLFFRQSTNLQTFDSALGGVQASPIEKSGDSKRPFSVDGDTFPDFDTAGQRSCDNQFQGCSKKANESGNKGGFKVSDCDDQKGKCNDAQKSATVKDFQTSVASTNIGPDPDFPDFDLICES
ncbi:hypothetical protein DPSP01_007771 [Paraphaeosphaeria sporulosa]|uniref:Uncharacterized protein n=1 Tax=Paraphaeosphaeria sporulosa TaxID=1460663 RepID=A0A177CKZ1_9PLEO|nr:uncharacterized protein CC84DRAFT_1216446 [Paraphaeosphaeria sporulosa]OAG07499.1 hypothetical protein CC84DRAFT_1216446 [Paraphaeosphaeria sporulosa]